MSADPSAPSEATLVALDAAIRRHDAPQHMRADLEAWLRAHDLSDADRQALLHVGTERLLVYRALVHNRMRNATRDFIPRTVARLGIARLRSDFDRFVDERASHSFYLRDVPQEFVAWVLPRWQADASVPAYVCDLARHELLDKTVRNDPAGGEAATGRPLALDRPLRFDGTARLVEYAYAVHRLPADRDDRTVPIAEPTALLVHRDRDHEVRYLQLTPFAAAVLRHLLAGAIVQDALRTAAADLAESLDDDKLASAAVLLADLADRHVMLGAI